MLAREVTVHAPTPHDAAAVFGVLRAGFESCYVFCAGRGDAAFVAASPELLIRRDGLRAPDRRAGRLHPPLRRPGRRRPPRRAAAASDKDREEQAIVARRIARALRPHAVWVAAPEEPAVIKVANIQHLATPIRAQLTQPLSAIELAGLLHPTPAVGGEPHAAAAPLIPALEGLDRGWYAGAGRLDGRQRRRRVLRRAALRAAARHARRGCTPASASCATPTPPPSWRRPRSSSARCCRCSPASRPKSRRQRLLVRAHGPACTPGASGPAWAVMVSVTRRSVIRTTSGASTNRSPSGVRSTMPSKMCSRALSSTRWTVPTSMPSDDTTGTPVGSA